MLILYLLMSYVAIRKARSSLSISEETKRMYDSASNAMVSLVLVLVHCGEVPVQLLRFVYVQ